MKEHAIAANIIELRKKKKITQEQLASALNISPQAVSKWETGACLPDTLTLPLLAEYFHVSIDYLYYGKDAVYDDIYEKNTQRAASCPQMSKASYEEALRLFAAAHHGITHGNLRGKELMYEEPSHISNENGVSLLSGTGFGAIVTRDFFQTVNKEVFAFSKVILEALTEENCLPVAAAIISMSDISFNELKDKLALGEEDLRRALDRLISSELVIEMKSKHPVLGTTYKMNSMYHTCLCILLAVLSVQKRSLKGISCCMGYGDFPIDFAL